jgi:hypothetical protein
MDDTDRRQRIGLDLLLNALPVEPVEAIGTVDASVVDEDIDGAARERLRQLGNAAMAMTLSPRLA